MVIFNSYVKLPEGKILPVNMRTLNQPKCGLIMITNDNYRDIIYIYIYIIHRASERWIWLGLSKRHGEFHQQYNNTDIT